MKSEQGTTESAENLADANMFTIDGPIAISYSSTSISGDPLFSYRDSTVDLHFRGDDISRVSTPVGEMVTVVVKQAIDAFTRTFTLVVPVTKVVMGEPIEFSTVGIECTDTSQAFVRPPGRVGVKQTYQVYDLRGRAESVVS